MAAGISIQNGYAGSLQTAQSRTRRGGAGADGIGDMLMTVVGNNGVAGGGPSAGLSPFQLMAETIIGREEEWDYNFDPRSFVSQGVTTDGAAGGTVFQTLTNSGTITLLSTQAGLEGKVLSTTGAASGNQNALIAVDGGLPLVSLAGQPAGGRLMWATWRARMPDPNVAAYDVWFGLFNKQVSPGATAPTDGCYFKLATAASQILVLGGSTSNSTAAATGTLATIASGVPQSIELGIIHVGQVGTNFYVRVPSVAPTFAINDGWVLAGSLSAAANLPRNTVVMRPHLVHYTRTAATHAINMSSFKYAIQRVNF